MESNLQGYAPYKSNVRPGRADAVAAERAFVIAAEAARPGTPAAAGSYSAKIQSPLSYEFCPHIQPPDERGLLVLCGFVISSKAEKSLTTSHDVAHREAGGARLALLERLRSLNELSQLGIQG